MAKKRNIRHFRSLSENLASLAPELRDHVACPLCLRLFDAHDYESGRLTHGHILPESVGGRAYTLVCAECNSFCGSNQDAHLKKYVTFKRGVPRGKEVRLRAEVAGKGINATLRAHETDEDTNFTLVFHHSNPPDEAEVIGRYLWEHGPGSTMRFSLKYGYDLGQVKVALLTAAYLEAFRCFGYWYILNENLDEIRRQILSPDSPAIAEAAWMELPGKLNWSAHLLLMMVPIEYLSIGFTFGGCTSILPIADDRKRDIYRRLGMINRPEGKPETGWSPFIYFERIPPNTRSGRWTMRTEEGELVATVAHPDARTVRRLSDMVQEPFAWMATAPAWAQGE